MLVGMKFQCVRSGELSGSDAFSRCSAVRLSRNAVALFVIAAPVRCEEMVLPIAPQTSTARATARRARLNDFIVTSFFRCPAVVPGSAAPGGRGGTERQILNCLGESDEGGARNLREQLLVAQNHLQTRPCQLGVLPRERLSTR